MANRKEQSVMWQRQPQRIFSESFKKQKVKEIERKLYTVLEVSRMYDVSRGSVYNWLDKYSMTNKRGVRLIIEPMSDAKKIQELQARIKELEQLVGQKQIQLEFTEKMIELAEERYQIDIKKKSGSKHSSGSGTTGKNIPGK